MYVRLVRTLTVMLSLLPIPTMWKQDTISGESKAPLGAIIGSAPDRSKIFAHDKDFWVIEAGLLLPFHSVLNR